MARANGVEWDLRSALLDAADSNFQAVSYLVEDFVRAALQGIRLIDCPACDGRGDIAANGTPVQCPRFLFAVVHAFPHCLAGSHFRRARRWELEAFGVRAAVLQYLLAPNKVLNLGVPMSRNRRSPCIMWLYAGRIAGEAARRVSLRAFFDSGGGLSGTSFFVYGELATSLMLRMYECKGIVLQVTVSP
jgi:hypothetical protein